MNSDVNVMGERFRASYKSFERFIGMPNKKRHPLRWRFY